MKFSTDGIPSFSPPNREIDFSYLEKYGNREKYQIPSPLAKSIFTKGQSFQARTTNIYDPSKFWMVLKFTELEVFQKSLFRFYYMNKSHYKIPEDEVQLNIYCVAFVDNAYYRGVIIGFPDIQRMQLDSPEVQVLFIDFGMQGMVSTSNIYYIAEKYITIPQFAVRASLANICPLKNGNWTCEAVEKFLDLVVDKILGGVIVSINFITEVMEVYLSADKDTLIPVHEILINEKHAKYVHFNGEEKTDTPNSSAVKYSYLFPSHEALESGKLPLSIGDAEFQLSISSISVLTKYQQRDSKQDETAKVVEDVEEMCNQ